MIIDPQLEQEQPLAMRMIENLPGLSASLGFSMLRGSNTMLYGGFMDKTPKTSIGRRIQARRASRYALMQNGTMTTPGAGGFYGGVKGRGGLGRRARRLAEAEKAPFLRSSRLNNITGRPRAFTRFHSMSIFSGAENVYSPFQGARAFGKTKAGSRLLEKSGITLGEGEAGFGPGLFSAISAGVKADRLTAAGSTRKLAKIDANLMNLARMNNPAMAGLTPGGTMGQVGARGNFMASSLSGAFTQTAAGYMRGIRGFGGEQNLVGRALSGAQKAESTFAKAFAEAFKGTGFKGFAETEGVNFLRSTGGKAFFKELGLKGTMAVARSGGAMSLGLRAGALAIPGLQILAAASLAYDLGKMGGEIVKSGINLVRDANRSLQGSIAKPAFGMGYKDTEAAATSRARGVQAIQNSRLNARSMLGTEAAMMAAHYG